MDPNGNIYRAPEDEIPVQDRARLEGYLHARAEEHEATYEAKLREMETADAVERGARALCEYGVVTVDGEVATWERHSAKLRQMARVVLNGAPLGGM